MKTHIWAMGIFWKRMIKVAITIGVLVLSPGIGLAVELCFINHSSIDVVYNGPSINQTIEKNGGDQNACTDTGGGSFPIKTTLNILSGLKIIEVYLASEDGGIYTMPGDTYSTTGTAVIGNCFVKIIGCGGSVCRFSLEGTC